MPRVARILLGFAMSGCYSLDPSPSVAPNAIKPSATPVSSSSSVDNGDSDDFSSSMEQPIVAKEEALGSAEESGREIRKGVDSSQLSLTKDMEDGEGEGASHIQLATGGVDGIESVRVPIGESSQIPDRQPDRQAFDKPVEELAERSSEGKEQEQDRAPIHGKVLEESTDVTIMNQAAESVFEALPEALSIPPRGGDSEGRDVDVIETSGIVGKGDSSRAELGGEICAAGERARSDILGALMPAAAVLIEDPTAEVRGTVAVSLGEMLRLMVGFEDYVSALGAMRSSNGIGVGVGVVKNGEISSESRGGRGAEGVSVGRGRSDSMMTCCCVTGEEEDGVDGGRVNGEGFDGGSGRRVCHGKLLRDAEEAAAAAAVAADVMAEATLTAELMDLAGFESVGDDRNGVNRDGDGSGAEGFPVEMEGDVDAHVNVLLRSDDGGAIASAEDFPPLSEGGVSPAIEEEGTDPPRLETFGGDKEDRSGVSCSNIENKGRVEFKPNGSSQHKSTVTGTAVAAASTRKEGGNTSEMDGSVEDGDVNCGKDVSGSKGDVALTAGDKEVMGGDDVVGKAEAMYADSMSIADGTADVAGGVEAIDVNFNGDPLIGLVRRLLLDTDANVACTMLQALRPVWGAELGPGPGPRVKASRDIAGYSVSAAVAGRGLGEGKGSSGEEDGISPVRRSCMLTPAQVRETLPFVCFFAFVIFSI